MPAYAAPLAWPRSMFSIDRLDLRELQRTCDVLVDRSVVNVVQRIGGERNRAVASKGLDLACYAAVIGRGVFSGYHRRPQLKHTY